MAAAPRLGRLKQPAIHIALARIQMLANRTAEAQRYPSSTSSTSDPGNVQAAEMLLQAYMATGRLQQAEGMLERLEAPPKTTPVLAQRVELLRGRLQRPPGERTLAVSKKCFANATSATPMTSMPCGTSHGPWRAKDASGKPSNCCKASRTTTPQFRRRLGHAWTIPPQQGGCGQPGPSLVGFHPGRLFCAPNHAAALRGMIDLQLLANNPAQVLVLCDRYLELHPASPDILYRKAFLQLEFEKNAEGALDAVTKALDLERRTEYLYLRGRVYLALGRHQDALNDLQEAGGMRDVNPADLDIGLAEAYLGPWRPRLGQTLFRLGFAQGPRWRARQPSAP